MRRADAAQRSGLHSLCFCSSSRDLGESYHQDINGGNVGYYNSGMYAAKGRPSGMYAAASTVVDWVGEQGFVQWFTGWGESSKLDNDKGILQIPHLFSSMQAHVTPASGI